MIEYQKKDANYLKSTHSQKLKQERPLTAKSRDKRSSNFAPTGGSQRGSRKNSLVRKQNYARLNSKENMDTTNKDN